MLTPRAQAIVDRLNALATNATTLIANDEAAHDAANAAANDADDTAIEGALTAAEGALGLPPTSADPLPAATPAPDPAADPAA